MWTFPQSSSEMIHQSNQNPPIFYTIDEHTLTQQWDKHSKDPFPIYTVIDKQCKQENEDPWFEITPHEAGYSLIGASVGVSKFGSQFEKGSMKKKQPEIDMLYLQALCGSAVADGEENRILLWKNIKDFFSWFRKHTLNEMGKEDPDSASVDKCFQVLLDLVDMNLCVLDGGDPSAHDESIRTTLTDINPEKHMFFPPGILDIHSKKTLKNYTIDVCINLDGCSHFWPIDICLSICKCMAQWIWGRKYNFLHNMKDEAVPAALLKSEKRDYEDAGLLLNSPYVSVLREERNINLIISLDFSDGDPFMTVKEAAKMCKERNIPFPKVNIPSEDLQKPKDFYVFKGQNAPTVIHIPLFNVVNCGDKIEDWRSKYGTFQGSYSAEMITDLMEVAGKNITNNKAKMVEQVRAIVGLQA